MRFPIKEVQRLVKLHDQGKVSTEEICKAMGLDYNRELIRIKEEKERAIIVKETIKTTPSIKLQNQKKPSLEVKPDGK